MIALRDSQEGACMEREAERDEGGNLDMRSLANDSPEFWMVQVA
jgi:hypothetical protein